MKIHSYPALIFGLLFVMGGLVFTIGSWGAYRYDTAILREGVAATAIVTDKNVIHDPEGNEYSIEYTLTPRTGQAIHVSRSIPVRLWENTSIGAKIKVYYDPENPQRNFPEGAGNTSLFLTVVISVFGSLFTVFGAFILSGSIDKSSRLSENG